MNSKRNIKIIADPGLLFEGLLCCIINVFICLGFSYMFFKDKILTVNEDEKFQFICFFLFMGMIVVLISLICLNKWLVLIELKEDKIRIKTPFKKNC